jgi:hypothetical protein
MLNDGIINILITQINFVLVRLYFYNVNPYIIYCLHYMLSLLVNDTNSCSTNGPLTHLLGSMLVFSDLDEFGRKLSVVNCRQTVTNSSPEFINVIAPKLTIK